MDKKRIMIIGGGLAGSLLSLYLVRRGLPVDVFEARGDMRGEEAATGRSINLALSDRGIAALEEVGLDDYMLNEAVPMTGRLVHTMDGETNLLPYSGRKGAFINSISRAGLNAALIQEADRYPDSTFHFNSRCVGFDCDSGEAIIEETGSGETSRVSGSVVFAADGAGSTVRKAMAAGGVRRFDFEQAFLGHGYKELTILPNEHGGFRMRKNALHIWARKAYMMIALPNFDGSFTCTLFLAHKGSDSFEAIDTGAYRKRGEKDAGARAAAESIHANNPERALLEFFEDNFPDAIPHLPDLADEYFDNPTGDLGTIKCHPWNAGGRALLIGDAAHAVVPFYGQGMNAAFEDCRILNLLIESHGTDWERIFPEFVGLRKENTDAIADMAVENFYEMRDHVTDPVFVRKRHLEMLLEQESADYFSKYSMVTFCEEIPYADAMAKGNAQDRLLMELCNGVEDVSELDLKEVIVQLASL